MKDTIEDVNKHCNENGYYIQPGSYWIPYRKYIKDNKMKETIQELEKEKTIIKKRLDDIDDAINAFRKVCKHVGADGEDMFKFDGSDSHADYYKCQICGYSMKD